MASWSNEAKAFQDKWLARLAWEVGRNSWCPAGVLSDAERTEREWKEAWQEICSTRPLSPTHNPDRKEAGE